LKLPILSEAITEKHLKKHVGYSNLTHSTFVITLVPIVWFHFVPLRFADVMIG